MDHPSDSDESDVDFVPDEKETSDVDSDTEAIKESPKIKGKRSSDVTEPVVESKRLRSSLALEKEADKKDYVKTTLDHSVDKNYEDDLWKSFLTAPESKIPESSKSKPVIETKVQTKAVDVKRQDSVPIGISSKRTPIGNKSGSGLSSVLNRINKTNKLSTLEKSKLDWNSFKKDEGIEEEVTTHNRGKDGYLERQDFLQRTDLRQFEIEKNVRSGRRGCS